MAAHYNETELSESNQADTDDFEFLKRGLLLGKGFQLYLIIANTIDEQKRFINKLSKVESLSVEAIQSSCIDAGRLIHTIHETFSKLIRSKGRSVVILHEIDELVSDEPRLLRHLNEQRNEIISQSSGALIILASNDITQRLRRESPDIWSVRDADIDVTEKVGSDSVPHIENPRLETIKPPVEENECIKLEGQISRLPYGEERGRLVLRLAEVCEFEGYSEKIIADYYEEASEQISDLWVSSMARINAARKLTSVKEFDRANQLFDMVQQNIENRDPSFQAYFYISKANLELSKKSYDNALKFVQHSIKQAAKSGDRDLLCDARMIRASIYNLFGESAKAVDDLKGAEQDALTTGNFQEIQRARAMLGRVSVSSGYAKQAKAAWDRYLDEHSSADFKIFNALVNNINELDKTMQPEAASRAWHILTDLAEEKGATIHLVQGVIHFLYKNVTEEKSKFDNFNIWLDRIKPYAINKEKDEIQLDINLLLAYESIKDNDISKIADILDENERIIAENSVGQFKILLNFLIQVNLLILKGKDVEAMNMLLHTFKNIDKLRMILKYFADHSRSSNSFSDLPVHIALVINLVVNKIGDINSIRDMVDLFTGGRAGNKVAEFFSDLEDNPQISNADSFLL